MMKNTLADLNNYLFESIERIMDDELSEEEMQKELRRGKAVADLAVAINQTAHTNLSALKLALEYGSGTVRLTGLLPEDVDIP